MKTIIRSSPGGYVTEQLCGKISSKAPLLPVFQSEVLNTPIFTRPAGVSPIDTSKKTTGRMNPGGGSKDVAMPPRDAFVRTLEQRDSNKCVKRLKSQGNYVT